jgi:predicted permease
VNGRSRTIAGVVPRFDHPALPASWRNAQVWLPLVWDNGVTSAEDRPLIVMARTAAGMEPAAAAARLETEAQAVNNGSNNGDLRVRVRPMDLSVSPTTRAMLLTAAVALSVVLSASASLLARSFGNLVAADRTIDLSPLLVVGLETARGTEDVIARVRSLQDVASVAVSDFTPLRGGGTRESVVLEESATQPSAAIVRRSRVTAGFFGTLGIGFDAGRPFTAMEERSRLPVVVVNRRMANQLWPHETAIGTQFRLANEVPAISYTVIGVSHDLSNWDAGMRPLPTMYTSFPDVSEDKRTLIVRATGDPRRLIQPVREIAASAGRAPRRPEPVLMEAVVRDAFSRQKTLALLFSVFSLLSLVLTAVGLYGVLSYFVSQQRRELGIRAALGAGRRDLIQLVAVRGLSMAAAGLAIGLVAAYAAMRVLRGLLYEVSTTDPLSAKVGVLVVVAVTLAASWLPAHRAASVEPARCLRDG